MYARAWASLAERRPENNEICSEEDGRKRSRSELGGKVNRLASTSAGTSQRMYHFLGFDLVSRWVGGLIRIEHWRAGYGIREVYDHFLQ